MSKETFLWRRVSKAEQAAIKAEAKQILDRFSKALAKVEKKIKKVSIKSKPSRREQAGKFCKPELRKRFFANAPNKEDDWILAEKGEWK